MVYRLADLGPESVPALLPEGASASDWPAARAATEEVWRRYCGELPDPVPVDYAVVAEHRETDHIRRHVVYSAPGDERVPALLLVPLDVAAGHRRAPAVLALHPTIDIGKADVATTDGRPNRRYGLELVRRGFVVLAPDVVTFGERVHEGEQPFRGAGFYARNPGWTATGRTLVDHAQGVELLCSLDEVDPARIGVIGHSLGGYNAFFLAGFDQRVRAAVCSCGFSMFGGDATPERWSRLDLTAHIPRIGEDLAAGVVPFEWHEIAALVAPKPLFVWAAHQDECFPHWPGIAAGLAELARLYDVLGHPENLVVRSDDGPHDFPPPMRQAAYEFLERRLGT